MAKRRAKRQLPPDIEPSAVAQRMAARIPEGSVTKSPAAIAMLLTVVLPMLMKNCGDDAPDDPDEVQAAVAKQHADNPDRLRRRTAMALMKEARASGDRISKADALETARGMIAETVEAHADDVGAFCSFHM